MRIELVTGVALCALATMALAPIHHEAGGTVAGKVTFTGTPPKMKPIDMAKEPSCAKEHATPVMNESVVTGPGNSLGDVVVYISAGGPATPAPTGRPSSAHASVRRTRRASWRPPPWRRTARRPRLVVKPRLSVWRFSGVR